jgi:hypothetical protein
MWINQGLLKVEETPKIVIARPTFSAGQHFICTVFGVERVSNFRPIERLLVARYTPRNGNDGLWENRGG